MSEETAVADEATKEDPIDQVRELLFGATKRQTDNDIRHVEARIEDVRADLLERLASLETRLVDLARETERDRTETVSAIGAAISQLGVSIQAMSAGRKN
jgi:hypothetical protein